jgi:hypothetical protein
MVPDQALVTREAEDVVDAVRLAPRHQLVPGKARVGPEQDLHPGPARPDLGDDARHLVLGPRRGVDVGAAKLRRQQMLTAEDIERQIAVAVVVAMEEAAFLMAMQRVVSRIQIKDDLARRRPVRLEEEVDEEALDGGTVVADPVVARGSDRRMLEPVQRALAGQRRAVLAPGDELAGKGRQHRVMAQLIVVDQVLVAERNAEHALRHHGLDTVLDQRLRAVVIEAGGEAAHQPDCPIGRAEQQPPSIRRDLPTVEGGHHLAALDHFISEQVAATLCRHRGAPPHQPNCLSQKSYR